MTTRQTARLDLLLLSLKFEENCAGCDEEDGDIVRLILRYGLNHSIALF